MNKTKYAFQITNNSRLMTQNENIYSNKKIPEIQQWLVHLMSSIGDWQLSSQTKTRNSDRGPSPISQIKLLLLLKLLNLELPSSTDILKTIAPR